MFESLSDKLQDTFRQLSGKGRLTEEDVDVALREVRLALLDADVNFKVVKAFVARVRERAIGEDVLRGLNPAQQVVKIVHEELVDALGGGSSRLETASQPPTIVMLVGLQGSGKTTTTAQLALWLRRQGQKALMVAADVRRPAAIEQLLALGRQLDIPVYHEPGADPVTICEHAIRRARELAVTWVLLDTAGRLSIDTEMMDELARIRARVNPREILFVADAMTGQEAVTVAQQFNETVPLTGLILTKADGDARGGAALSIRSVVGAPIKFVGTGEKLDALEAFHPDRLASRILGMGDVMTLIERVQADLDMDLARRTEKKLRKGEFTLEDFLDQLQQVKRMGSFSQLLGMIPGMNKLAKQMPSDAVTDHQIRRVEAIIRSMTIEERRHPEILNGSRRRRIAAGSGTTPADVNQLLNQFRQTQKLMKQMAGGKVPPGLARLLR